MMELWYNLSEIIGENFGTNFLSVSGELERVCPVCVCTVFSGKVKFTFWIIP